MNRKLIRDALDMIDDAFIEECIVRRSTEASASSGRESKTMKYQFTEKRTKRLIAVAAAAALVLMMAVTAVAANLWGIRDLFESSGRELPSEADGYVQSQSCSVSGEGWTCTVRESLCDGEQVTAAAVINCSDDYIVAPTDSSASDPAESLGIDSDLTLGEYAASQGKRLIYVNVGISFSEAPGKAMGGYLHFKNIADNEMLVLSNVSKAPKDASSHGICTVYVTRDDGTKEKASVDFDIITAPVISKATYVPVDASSVPGITVGEATVAQTVMGISIEFKETVTDFAAFDRMEMVCEGIQDYMGGSVMENGEWYLKLTDGQGTVSDTLTIRVVDVRTGELMGTIVFEKQ